MDEMEIGGAENEVALLIFFQFVSCWFSECILQVQGAAIYIDIAAPCTCPLHWYIIDVPGMVIGRGRSRYSCSIVGMKDNMYTRQWCGGYAFLFVLTGSHYGTVVFLLWLSEIAFTITNYVTYDCVIGCQRMKFYRIEEKTNRFLCG